MKTYLISVVAIYIAGFFVMFSFSAWYGGKTHDERDPVDAFIIALLWPLMVMIFAVCLVLGRIGRLFGWLYNACYNVGKK
ncbi:hypothetical protein ACSFCW_23865 [Yokenella regensburgei]|uniref:hypothetical protein n=1 Tax=Yokenella regensburgei TaxID=158877 RepID=UPI003ED94516